MAAAMDTDENAQQGPQGRLVITKMVLNNFKSYQGERSVGPFHKVLPLEMPYLVVVFVNTAALPP